jgi:cobalt-zinc-cadmium efflux system outer membrane protein
MHFLVLLTLLAADPATLAQIEAEALAKNPDIQAAAQRTRVAEARIGSAMGFDDPQFSYRAWSTPILQPWNLNQTQHMFMLSENVPGRGKRELRYLIASGDKEIQSIGVEARKREIVSLVRNAFYRLLRSRDQLSIHHDQVALAEQTIEATRIQYTAGKATQLDVLKAGTAHARLAGHRIMIEREAEAARAELNSLMGRSADEPLEIEGEFGVLDRLPSSPELVTLALANRPELLALEAMAKQGEHKVRLAQKGYSPDFMISAGYMLMPSGSMNRNGWMGEVSLTLPWLNRGKHDSEIRGAQEELNLVQAESRKQRTAISREVRDALIRAESARKTIDLYRDTLRPSLQGLSSAATVAYRTNQGDLLNVLDTQGMSFELEYALFDAITEYEQSLAELERAIGAPLPGERKPL